MSLVLKTVVISSHGKSSLQCGQNSTEGKIDKRDRDRDRHRKEESLVVPEAFGLSLFGSSSSLRL
jgi:hypothetical protein